MADDILELHRAVSTIPRFRGRKLVLAYENGSPCPHAPELRKSSLFSLMCDHEAYSKPSVSFVGQFNDCSYFFELRTSKACPKVKAAETIAPVAVFTIMLVQSSPEGRWKGRSRRMMLMLTGMQNGGSPSGLLSRRLFLSAHSNAREGVETDSAFCGVGGSGGVLLGKDAFDSVCNFTFCAFAVQEEEGEI